MKHSELKEILERLTDEVASLGRTQRETQQALSQWHEDQQARERVQDEAIERNRESLKKHGERLRKLEGSKSHSGEK